jgi:xanthine dehydrogenase large subunit
MKANQKHLSGKLHVTGTSTFVENIQHATNRLYAYPLVSKHAHALVIAIDESSVADYDYTLILAKDIPGLNNIAHGNGDNQPLLPLEEVNYIGQPIAIVVASSREEAILISRKIKITYELLEHVIDVEEAKEKSLEYASSRAIKRKEESYYKSYDSVKGKLKVGFQEHFYFETQRCLTIPEENGCYTIYSSTQGVSEIQEIAAKVLNLASHHITVDVRRLGGAFGGKEAQATLWACLTTLACYIVRKAVYLELERKDDMCWTGKRHQFVNEYEMEYSQEGKITKYNLNLNANGGAYIDLSHAILERGLLHADSGYYFPELNVNGQAFRTNLPPNTAFRGFGAPQAILTTELALEQVAYKLGMDRLQIRQDNVYVKGQKAHYGMEVYDALGKDCYESLKEVSSYELLKERVNQFNENNRYTKQGIGIISGKFGISFTAGFLNQGSSLVWIYSDGSISISHGGIEMGQQLYTKINSVACRILGVSEENIRIESTNTKRIGNSSPTAASSGSDLNGNATRIACEELKARLTIEAVKYLSNEFKTEILAQNIIFENNMVFDKTKPKHKISFKDLVHVAYMNRVDLGAHGFYKTPGVGFDRSTGKGTPFYYYVFGCAHINQD